MTWLTTIRAVDPRTGELKEWAGPSVDAPTRRMANRWLQNNGFGYCSVVGYAPPVATYGWIDSDGEYHFIEQDPLNN